MMPRRRSSTLLAVACAIAAAASFWAPSRSAAQPRAELGPYNLTILHTNDAHGAFLPEAAKGREGGGEQGGSGEPDGQLIGERSVNGWYFLVCVQ